MINFLLSHLGASVVLASILEASGVKVFARDSDDTNALVNPYEYNSMVVSYVVLLDVLSKALFNKVVQLSKEKANPNFNYIKNYFLSNATAEPISENGERPRQRVYPTPTVTSETSNN